MIVFDRPLRGNIKLFLPKVSFVRNSYDGEWDFEINIPTRFYMSGYEYGFLFEFQILGFGFGIFKAKNIY